MEQAPLPPHETERLEALYRYQILDTPPEKELDDLVHLAASICRTPIALISLVDSDRQWFKSKVGLTVEETSRHIAFCAHTILENKPLIVPDALADERFKHNPLVTREPHIRFYYGTPLVTPEGFRIGTLSVIDHVPRILTSEQQETLEVFSRQVIEHLMLNRSLRELTRAHNRLEQMHDTLRQSEETFRALSESSPSAIFIYRGDRILYANQAAALISGYPVEELLTMDMWTMGHPDFLPLLKARALAVQEGAPAPARYEFKILRKDGQERWLDLTAATVNYGGQPARLATGYDITERKRGEVSLRIQSRILELIAIGTPIRETLDTLVRSIEAQSDGMLASILLLDADGVHVRCGAAPNLPESFIRAIDGESIGPCAGSCGTAAFRREVVIVEDIATDPLWDKYRDLALPHGLRACWSTPIFDRQRRVLGTFALYFRTPGRPTARHMRLVGMATHTAAIAIECKQAAEALVEREEHLRLFIEHSPVALAMFDRDMRYLTVSRRWMTDYKLGDGPIIGRSHYEVFPEIPQRWKEIHRRCLAGAVERCEEDVFVRADGLTDWLRWEILPWRTAGGDIGGIVIFTEDITDRKRAEEGARRWQQVFEKALFGLAYGNISDDTFLAVNEAFASQRGYRVDELIGQSILSIYAPDVRDAMKARLPEIDRRGHLLFESVHQRKDGTTFPVLMEVTVIKDTQGKPISRVAYALDITDRNRAYEALQESYHHLQALSREVQIAQERERSRLSRELHDEFGQLLSALKFDINAIADALLKIRSPAVSVLRKRAKMATGTVDRLFSSLREMVAALRPAVLEELGLVPAVQTIAAEVQERSGLHCHVVADQEIAEQSFGVELEGAFFRIAQELLTNVARHAKAKRVTISLRGTDGWGTLVVEDDGKGFRSRSALRKGRFGLRGVQERAELLGGNVEIRSKPGSGTVVTVRLPVKPPLPSEGAVAFPPLQKSVTARKRGRHGKEV